jgi:hypothetical protein
MAKPDANGNRVSGDGGAAEEGGDAHRPSQLALAIMNCNMPLRGAQEA